MHVSTGLGSAFCMIIIDKVGRKKLMIGGFSFEFCCGAIVYYTYGQTISYISLYLLFFAHGLASGPIAWIYITDIVPDIGVAIFWIFRVSLFVPVILYSQISYVREYIWHINMVLTFIAVFFIVYVVKETKGKS